MDKLNIPSDLQVQLQTVDSFAKLRRSKKFDYLKSIMHNGGAPSLEELMRQQKDYFEGPVNMDLMMAGAARKTLRQLVSSPLSSLQDLMQAFIQGLRPLAVCLAYSSNAIQQIQQSRQLDFSYLILKQNVEPVIKDIQLLEGGDHEFQSLLFSMETAIFARQYAEN
mmetsp:Transcript_2912/g.4944  ORF Transcript_2912/g.4944 Transcript_2912/m.4944 type:complete len:166 (-) Transcript_2912:109-606(-)